MTTKYKLIEHENQFHEDHWCVEILEGEFKGLAYQYDVVNFKEIDEEAVLDFNTVTVKNPNNIDLEDDNLETVLGDVLVDIINSRLEEEELNGSNASNTVASNT
jgi:hypothetical protein